MVDQSTSVFRRRGGRKSTLKTNDSNKTNDDLESGLLCPYQLIFLIESTLNNTKYIEVYKNAIEDLHNAEDQACNVVVIDHNQLVESLDNSYVEQNEQYRLLHERAKRYLNNNNRVSTRLMVLLVRQSIIIGLESMRQKWNFNTEPYTFNPSVVNIILTNFFDLEFITEFIATKIKVDAVVKLSCGEIAQTREKFVSRAFRDKQSTSDKVIQTFWQDFHSALNTVKGASVFKNVVVYKYNSKYSANYEPPNIDKMLVMARKYVMREMDRVHAFVYSVRSEYEKYIKNDNPVYDLPVNNDDLAHYYESYAKHLKGYPEDAIGLPVMLDAMVKAVISGSAQPTEEWADGYFGRLKDESDVGCMVYPVCVQYGNECGLIAKKYNLRHTNYLDSTVNVLNARWKKSLWGSRPLPPLDTEAEYNRIISDVKQECEGIGNDVDVQLCVLGLNRLRNNLNLYRGEHIDLGGLGRISMKFKPEFIEPAGCVTMVQMLQKESENYKRMSYAYFEPEDVVLVGFYDCPSVLQTYKSSFKFKIPQIPVYAKDYFDLYYDKRTPKCFYAMGTSDLSQTYVEETEEIRFKDDDFLTISKRKWRFEPSTLSLVYKSEHNEIVKHVTVDDDKVDYDEDDEHAKDNEDWLRVCNNNAGFEYYVDKSRKNVIRCIGRATWKGSGGTCTVEMVSTNNGMLQQSNQQRDGDGGARVDVSEVQEVCRIYSNGQVGVEYADGTKATYWSSGKVERPSRTTRASSIMETSKSTVGRRRGSTRSSSTDSVRSKIGASKSVRVKKSKARKNARSTIGVDRSPSRMSRKKSASNNSSSTGAAAVEDDNVMQPLVLHHADYVERFSIDGTTKTVEFADGTRIRGVVTNVRRRSSAVGPPYEYIHPAYRTVTEYRDGMFRVAGFCELSRGLAGGLTGLRLIDRYVRIDVTADAVYVYSPDDGAGGSDNDRLIATFGWNGSEFLFEKRVDGERLVTVPRRYLGDDLVLGTAGTATVTTEEAATASECFIIKRGMSGFRTLDGRRFERFVDGVRGHQHMAMRKSPQVFKTVVVYATDDRDEEKTGLPVTAAIGGPYGWLRPFSRRGAAVDGKLDPTALRLTSRSIRETGVDYGPLLDALTRPGTGSGAADVRPAKLRVRAYVPGVDALRKMYEARDRENRNPSSSRRDPAHDERFAAKLACLRREGSEGRAARSLMRRNRFIPFFSAGDFRPLAKHLKANGL